MSRPLLVLVGPPGSGKSTVGKVLARRLAVTFTDVDTVVEERVGTTIADMFTTQGEPAFRAVEREVVAELLDTECGVLALGGGSVLAAETRALLAAHRVVSLQVSLADGIRRTGMSTARPLLAGVNPRATFRTLLEARAPLYAQVATIQVDTARRSANQVAAAVLAGLGLETVEQQAGGSADADPNDQITPSEAAPLPDPVLGRPTD
ncbi:shikimate kinase [Pseudonocardia sp. WMMC193]|uniref:shikimate kinase n=1 Tax=Pseudonocardia sp. WMMC193 TaxID=2911965 RepID=UPI001F3BD709|nr:shikimate kinase [Pseudonocardia sp. WMMC193]MCF7549190.1 shikimate kinase [Pseudonocardia sp. WMMC193]